MLKLSRDPLRLMKRILQSELHILKGKPATTTMIERLTSHKKCSGNLYVGELNGSKSNEKSLKILVTC